MESGSRRNCNTPWSASIGSGLISKVAGDPIWTNLGSHAPEQPGQFNFAVRGGTGAAWILTPVGIEYRLSIRPHFQWWDAYADSGLNFGLFLFAGFTYSIF